MAASTKTGGPSVDVTAVPQGGAPSATAQKAAVESGADEKRRAEAQKIDYAHAEDVEPDAVAPGQKPTGLQSEPAAFSTNGEIPLNTVASPSGPVGVSAVTSSPEQAEALLEQRREQIESEGRRSAFRELSEEEVEGMDGATLRAIAYTRGYKDFPQGGRRTSARAFLRAQAEDENLDPAPRRAKAR